MMPPDLSAFHAPYAGDERRNAPYDPRMMVRVLVYAYATGTFSSRKWRGDWRRMSRFGCWRRATSRSNRTLCEFRRRHLDDFRAVFAEVVVLARAMGLGRVSVEGENQLVVDAGVTNNASEQGQLIPMVDEAAEVYGETPGITGLGGRSRLPPSRGSRPRSPT